MEIEKDLNFKCGTKVVEVAKERRMESPIVYFLSDEGDYRGDIELRRLGLSRRALSALLDYGMNSLLQISLFSYQDFFQLKGLGAKSQQELLRVIAERAIVHDEEDVLDREALDSLLKTMSSYFSPFIDASVFQCDNRGLISLLIFKLNLIDKNTVLSEDTMVEMASYPPLYEDLKRLVLSVVPQKIYYGLNLSSIISMVSKYDSRYFNLFHAIIQTMIGEKELRIIDDKIYVYKTFLAEWIESLKGNYGFILKSRCRGLTLEEIGTKLSITRERVRQLVGKAMRRRPELYEDDYGVFIENYGFTVDEFVSLLNLSREQVNYLLFVFQPGASDVQDFVDDMTVPVIFKENVGKTFRDSVLVFDGECVPLKREVLLRKILKTFYSDEDCTISEFADFYMDFLHNNHIAGHSNLLFPNKRALEARITDYPYTIAKRGHRIRYYDTTAVDINLLFKEMDMASYNDTEISTLKLVRDHPEVMENYDIRDEYELHNLIRKKHDEIEGIKISLTRMPSIRLGSGNRDRQVEDLLIQLAPISNYELAAEYEERYGVRANTVMANYFHCIDIYYHDGIFNIEQQDLSAKDNLILKNELSEGAYLWDTIVSIYQRVSANPVLEAINPMTLKKLGFKVYKNYVISADYSSVDAFFKDYMLKNKVFDPGTFEGGEKRIQAYYTVLMGLRDSLDLIEVERNIYYRYDYFAEQYAIESKDYLMKLGAELSSKIGEKDYFSIDKMSADFKSGGSDSYLCNPCILNSILRVQPGINTARAGSIYLGTKRKYEVSRLALIIYLAEKNIGMLIGDFVDLLLTEYELHIDRSVLVYSLAQGGGIYYDKVSDRIEKK